MTLTNFPDGVSSFGIPQLGNGDIPTGGGEYFFVDSNNGYDGYDGSWETPFATLDYAVGKCTANKNSIIVVMPNHAETLEADSAVDIDIAGVTVVGLGVGDDRPAFTFATAVTADFKLAANNVSIHNLLFVAGIDALTGPLEVSADYCSIINCEYQDDTVNNYETTNVIVSASTPLHMTIDRFKYVCDGGAGGTQNETVIYLSGSDFARITNCWLVADSSNGVIYDAATSDQILIENCLVENTETSPTVAVFLQGTTTGSMRYCSLRVASGTTYVTAVNDMSFFECYGTGTDATAGEKIGTIIAGDLEAKIDVIDAYHDIPTANGTDNVVMSDVIGSKADNAAAGAVTTTESLVAYVKQLVGGQIIIDAYHDVATADATTNLVMSDVIGNKSDAAAAGAVTTTESLMAYAKQNVGATNYIGTIVNAGGTATIGGVFGDFANDTLVSRLDDIGSNVNSTTTDNIQGKIGTDTELADRSLYDILNGGGPAAAATAAAPANNISMYAVARSIYDRQMGDGTSAAANSVLGKRVTKTGVVSAADDLFTVTGACYIKLMYGIVSTLVAGGTAPEILVNVKDGSNSPISASTVITDDAVGTIYWVMGDASATFNGGTTPLVGFAENNANATPGFIVNDITIESTPGGTAAATAGAIDWVIFYVPLEDSAAIAAAA